MKVFGAAPNLALFERYALTVLVEARMDYERALPFVEVYLGEVFGAEAEHAADGQIFVPEFEASGLRSDAEAQDLLERRFFPCLGKAVQYHYLANNSPGWEDYVSRLQVLKRQPYPPAGDLLSPENLPPDKVFLAALSGQEVLRVKRVELSFDCHGWRQWFYSLWGQSYEWGRLKLQERMAEANGELYYLTQAPILAAGELLIEPACLLQAHGFKVVLLQDGTLQYWR